MEKLPELKTEERREPGTMDVIYGAYPPNIDMIAEAFPMALKPGVVFAYGDEIYVPSGKELTHHLKVHEAVHGLRQKEIGLDFWWQRYIEDEVFRYNEELIAHFGEYRSMIVENQTRPFRRKVIKFIAKKLAHPLYCCEGGFDRALKDLKKMERGHMDGGNK